MERNKKGRTFVPAFGKETDRKQKEIIERLYIEEKKDEGKYKPFVLRDI